MSEISYNIASIVLEWLKANTGWTKDCKVGHSYDGDKVTLSIYSYSEVRVPYLMESAIRTVNKSRACFIEHINRLGIKHTIDGDNIIFDADQFDKFKLIKNR